MTDSEKGPRTVKGVNSKRVGSAARQKVWMRTVKSERVGLTGRAVLSGLMWVLVFPLHAQSEQFCGQAVAVEIERLVPPIFIKGKEENRKEEIVVLMPIDCASKIQLQPASLEQALDWLDKALPVDYKAGLLKGNTFLYSPYGSSVGSDLTDFLQQRWRLVKHGPVCTEAMSLMEDKDELQRLLDDDDVVFCGPDLLNALKSSYLR